MTTDTNEPKTARAEGSAPRLRLSIEPTYDSRKIGPPYTIQSRVNGVFVQPTHPAFDPFHTTKVHVHWLDVLRAWVRGKRPVVEVSVMAVPSLVEDVMELDGNYLGQNTTRRTEFHAHVGTALERYMRGEDTKQNNQIQRAEGSAGMPGSIA